MRLTFAQLFYLRGVPVVPCYPGAKHFKKGFGPYLSHARSQLDLYSWLEEEDCNYALLTGHSGLIVLDFDDTAIYTSWAASSGDLGKTFTVSTSRGYHVYFFADDLRSWKGDGLEVMGNGKAVIGPHSIHPSGAVYYPLNSPVIKDINSPLDFPSLEYLVSRPVLPDPPKNPPKRFVSPHLSGSSVKMIKLSWPVLEAFQLVQPETFKSLEGDGAWRTGLCPFHADENPSLWINTDRNIWGCHACQAHGDVINLVAMTYKLPVRDAIKKIVQAGTVDLKGVGAL
jgi:hypothetical protein